MTKIFDGTIVGKEAVLAAYETARRMGPPPNMKTKVVSMDGYSIVADVAKDVKSAVRAGVLAELRDDGTDDEVLHAAEVLARPEVQEAVSRAAQDFWRSTRRSGVTRVVMAEAVAHGAPRRGWQPVCMGGVWRAERSPQAIRAAAQRVRGAVRMRGGL